MNINMSPSHFRLVSIVRIWHVEIMVSQTKIIGQIQRSAENSSLRSITCVHDILMLDKIIMCLYDLLFLELDNARREAVRYQIRRQFYLFLDPGPRPLSKRLN